MVYLLVYLVLFANCTPQERNFGSMSMVVYFMHQNIKLEIIAVEANDANNHTKSKGEGMCFVWAAIMLTPAQLRR